MECSHCHCVFDRLTAYAAKFDGASEGQILKFEGAQIINILGKRSKCNFFVFTVRVVFTGDGFLFKVVDNVYRWKVDVLVIPFNAVDACLLYICQYIICGFKFTVIHTYVVRINAMSAVLPEHITAAQKLLVLVKQD